MSRRLTARDLRHDADSVRFGDAMIRCEGYAPDCSEQGRCRHDGKCFSSEPELVAARMVEGLIPAGQHIRGVHYAYLRRVAEMLREGRVYL